MNSNGLIPKPQVCLDETIDFRSLFYTFWEKKFIILGVTLVFLMLAAFYTYSKPLEYHASFMLQVETKGNSQLSILSQQLGGGAKEMSTTAKQMALIRSRFILEPVVKKLDLATSIKRHQMPILGKIWKNTHEKVAIRSLSVPPDAYNKTFHFIVMDKSHYHLLNDEREVVVQGEVGKLIKQNGIEIQVDSIKAKPGADFDVVKRSNTSIVNSLLGRVHIEELGDANSGQTGILEVSLTDTDPNRLVKVLNTITEVVKEKDTERKSLESATLLRFLKQQLPLVKKSLREAEETLNRYQAKTGKVDIKLESQYIMLELSNIQKRIIEANLAKSDLLQKFTEQHPVIIGVGEKIKQLEKQKSLLFEKMKSLPESNQTVINLMRDARVKNNMYVALLNKIQEMEVAKAATVSDVRVLVQAIPPEGALSKRVPVILSAAAILGTLLGCLTVLITKTFLRCVKDPRWIEQHLHLTNLAIVPYSKMQASYVKQFKNKQAKQLNILADKFPKDLAIESLRSLRTSFQLMQSASTNNIITFLGIGQGIGKSFVSINFSYLLADLGKRVLVIDGDLRKGYMQYYFNSEKSPGLSELLKGSAPLENIIRRTHLANLDFMSCGLYPENPAELLLSPTFQANLAMLSAQYDYVVIDTAPTLAVTDGIIIATHAGSNLLVLGSDVHQPEECLLAVRRLQQANVKLLGTVFNILKPEAATYGGFHYKYAAYEADEPVAS